MPGGDDMRPGWDASAASAPDQNPRVKLTYDDYLLFPEDDGQRHELIDGVHYVSPTPLLRHQRISGRLYLAISNWVAERRNGEIFYAPLAVILSKFDVVEPDLLYVSPERKSILTDQWVSGAPDLVVEVGSPSTSRRDETIKRRLYERSDVREYWIVDPKSDAIRVYQQTAGNRFDTPTELTRENADVLTTPLLPGLEISLADVFGKD
jgi:Uma2 family endonuclease